MSCVDLQDQNLNPLEFDQFQRIRFLHKAMPLEELRSACDARGLVTHGTQQQLVGRLAALLVPLGEPSGRGIFGELVATKENSAIYIYIYRK